MLPGQAFTPGSGVTGAPLGQTAGAPFTVTVYAVDPGLRVVTTAPGTVSLTTTDPYDTEPPAAALVSGQVSFTINPRAATTTGWTIRDTGGPGAAATSAPYLVVAGAATQTIVVLPGQSLQQGNGVAGTPLSHLPAASFSATVYATDAYSNIVASQVSTVSLTDSDAAATVGAPQALAGGSASLAITNQTIGLWIATPSGGPGTQRPSTAYYVSRTITTIAGTGALANSGDGGPATAAAIGLPYSVVSDGAGGYYVSSVTSNVVRRVNSSGTISTVAGGGSGCPGQTNAFGDGCPATSAILGGLLGLAVDGGGRLYIADQFHQLVRMVDPATGVITSVAGNGIAGYSGDNGPATLAQLNYPIALAVDGAGNLYIADKNNHRVREVTVATGLITDGGR